MPWPLWVEAWLSEPAGSLQSCFMYPVSCVVLAELFKSSFSPHFVAVIPRELKFGLCCYPQAERISPAGQLTHGLTVHPERSAAQEENS